MTNTMPIRRVTALLLGSAFCAMTATAQNQPPPTPQQDSLRTATRFDVQGQHAAARAIFQQLANGASDAAAKAAVHRRLALSHAFEGDCAGAVRYEEMVIDFWKTREAAEPQNAFYQQGEMANEAARVCIDVGQLDVAERMYRRGSELGLKEPMPKSHPQSLWNFRLAHAMGRLAARRGNAAEARRHVAEARRILDADSTMASQQARFLPYLAGYVALYTNDLATAESELTKALAMAGNTNDPFLHVLLGMAYEKKGDAERAKALYQKAYDLSTGHNPPAAFSRPFARKKIGAA